MVPKVGDIITINFGDDHLYYGVLRPRNGCSDDRFVAYSLEAEKAGRGHDGNRHRGRTGCWFTSRDGDGLNEGVALVSVPPRKTAILDRSCRMPRVTLSREGRLNLNVAPEHGGPYGEGTVVGWSGKDACTVEWDNGFRANYPKNMLDVVLPALMQKALWEEPDTA